MTRDIEESPGIISMMRILARRAVNWGGVMIAASIVLALGMLALDRNALTGVATALAAGGAGLIASALGAKAWQAQSENKEP